MNRPYLYGGWLFLFGCVAFSVNAVVELADSGLTLANVAYLGGCALFTVGCVLFIVDARRQ